MDGNVDAQQVKLGGLGEGRLGLEELTIWGKSEMEIDERSRQNGDGRRGNVIGI